MNLLPFVITVLLILSYGTTASLQNRIASRQNQKAHLGLRNAELKILQQCEQQHYSELPGTSIKSKKVKSAGTEPKIAKETPKFNLPSAQLNLFPLVDKGREEHPALYETAAKLLRTFYQIQKEYKLLDAILAAAKSALHEKLRLPIETLAVKDFQPLYYTLLKGTKKIPPLIDYLKIERIPSQVNLFDADIHMLTVFFGTKTAELLYDKLQESSTMHMDAILELDPHLAFVDEAVWKLLNFTKAKPSHLTLSAQDAETGISLRKDLLLKPESAAK